MRTCLPHLKQCGMVNQVWHHQIRHHQQTGNIHRYNLHQSPRLWEQAKSTHTEMIKNQKGAVQMIKDTFSKPVFLDLCDNEGKWSVKHCNKSSRTCKKISVMTKKLRKKYSNNTRKWMWHTSLHTSCKYISRHCSMREPFLCPYKRQSWTRWSLAKGPTI